MKAFMTATNINTLPSNEEELHELLNNLSRKTLKTLSTHYGVKATLKRNALISKLVSTVGKTIWQPAIKENEKHEAESSWKIVEQENQEIMESALSLAEPIDAAVIAADTVVESDIKETTAIKNNNSIRGKKVNSVVGKLKTIEKEKIVSTKRKAKVTASTVAQRKEPKLTKTECLKKTELTQATRTTKPRVSYKPYTGPVPKFDGDSMFSPKKSPPPRHAPMSIEVMKATRITTPKKNLADVLKQIGAAESLLGKENNIPINGTSKTTSKNASRKATTSNAKGQESKFKRTDTRQTSRML